VETGKGEQIWLKYCVQMYVNGKLYLLKLFKNRGREGNKGEWWRGWIQVWYSWYLVGNFENATMYPHPAQNKKKWHIYKIVRWKTKCCYLIITKYKCFISKMIWVFSQCLLLDI
jgi:hypothetical protein